MEPLSSIDASFILTETPGRPAHISSISIYDPSSAPDTRDGQAPVRFKHILELFQDAIYDVPMLRRRLAKVPGNLEFPVWVEDPDFDIEFHVRHIALPKPGDWRQFNIQLARLHARPLDMSRPLWEITVIEGLNHLEGIPSGSFALVQKLHHSAVDGAAARKLFLALNDKKPGTQRKRHKQTALIRERRPSPLGLVFNSYQRTLKRPARLLKAAAKTANSVYRVTTAQNQGEINAEPQPPESRFNRPTSPHRMIASATFDLAEFRRLLPAVPGATLNDLALSICGGALNRYLAGHGEPVDQPLIAQVPVDIRSVAEQLQGGNVISTINASSGSDITDPLQRLQTVHQSTRDGKKRLELLGASLNHEVAEALGPLVTRAVFSLIYNPDALGPLGKLMPPPPNFVFSNMPGPEDPVYLCGSELVWGTGLGPLMPNAGLFIAVNTIRGKLVYGVTACRDMMPDPEFFQQCLYDEFEAARAACAN